MLEWRLKAYRHWLTMEDPDWAKLNYPPIDYQDIHYYAAPKKAEGPKSLDEVDPELLRTYEKLGIPLREQEMLAGVRLMRFSIRSSVATTFREKLAEAGVIFCPISEAIRDYPELVQKYIGSVVPQGDNYFSALNSAVFTDGSFVYIPEGVRCPMELSTYFRINEKNTGQFERTLIIAEEGSYVSYLEGCTAPQRDDNQLHAAVVELVATTDAEIKYSTVQNWYPGDENGQGRIYNLSPSVAPAVVTDLKSHGRRLKPAQRSPGNIRPVFFRVRTRSVNFTGRRHQQRPAGGYRHQDDPYRPADQIDNHCQRYCRRQIRQHLSRPCPHDAGGRGRT